MFAQSVQRSPVLEVSRSWKPAFRSLRLVSQKSRNHFASSFSSRFFILFRMSEKDSILLPWFNATSTIKPRVNGDVITGPGRFFALPVLSEKSAAKVQYNLTYMSHTAVCHSLSSPSPLITFPRFSRPLISSPLVFLIAGMNFTSGWLGFIFCRDSNTINRSPVPEHAP
ncbi:hypothetical protein PBCV1_a293R [Paramecium bursaria Chlorella virus 1]|uniref:Uncharacterized protein n=1 Tax=Paramecium bursaria Chlorella virus 1 TaxID=10506 RepID=Q84609_PBCV1|nr:hypothetical protein PBCV1_a293R [Paramecium bursaria Chlorella virus 1]AAC96661.1 hypothetical protein [Paramecium bursaria Chlorella virus 1]